VRGADPERERLLRPEQQFQRDERPLVEVELRLRATISSGGSTGIVSAKPEGDSNSFCISAVSDGHWAHYSGPGGAVVADPSTVTENPCS
jgi:hypothetical protein